jgi:hypothetical protein
MAETGNNVDNLLTITALTELSADPGLSGICLWPAAALHTGMAVWCINCSLKQRCKVLTMQNQPLKQARRILP